MNNWVKVSVDIRNHPKLLDVAAYCEMTPREIESRIIDLWKMAITFYKDGNITDLKGRWKLLSQKWDMDIEKTKVLFSALMRFGFIDKVKTSNGYVTVIHHWLEHGSGVLERQRANNAKRQEKFRKGVRNGDVTVMSPLRNGYVTAQRRGEKKRLKEQTVAPDGSPSPPNGDSPPSAPSDERRAEILMEFGFEPKGIVKKQNELKLSQSHLDASIDELQHLISLYEKKGDLKYIELLKAEISRRQETSK